MSLYKDASLVMIPSAVKDGKLYSIRPTDGSGDFTFSRGSNLAATRVDVNGLIEKGRENLLLYSNQFDTTWVPQSGMTLTANQQGYDGTNDAWKLEKNASSYRNIRISVSVSGVYTTSVYAKAGTLDLLTIRDGSNQYARFYLSTGTYILSNSPVSGSMVSVGNGWYRCSVTMTTSNPTIQIYPDWNQTNAGYIYIQDAQLEQSMVATDYIETGASTAQAGILEDLPRLDYSGGASCPSLLLEPQRANLVVNSEYANSTNWSNGGTTYSNNQTTSPEGVNNAIKLIEDNSTTFHYLGSDISGVATAGTYSISGFIKKGTRRYGGLRAVTNGYVNRYFLLVDLDDGSVADTYTQGSGVTWSYDIKDYGNGWYRIEISGGHTSGTIGGTFSPSDTASPTYFGALPDYNGSTGEHIFCYGLQAELGSYPTSYIPTYGSAVTRSGDSAIAENLGISDSYTLFIEYNDMESTDTNFQDYIALQDSTSSGKGLRAEGVGNSWRIYPSGLTNTMTFPLVGSVNRLKKALVVTPTSIKLFEDGALRASTTGTLDSHIVDVVSTKLSTTGTAPTQIASSWKQLLIFPTALTDSECIALTTI